MKQSFLKSLVGLKFEEAEQLVEAADLKAHQLSDGCAIIALAVPGTVNIWVKQGIVTAANAGDGLELERDV